MRRWIVLVPLAGVLSAVAVPLVRHVEKQRHEAVAIDVLHEVRAAQERFRGTAGAYAADLRGLVAGCTGQLPVLDAGWLTRLERAGYTLLVRTAAGAAIAEGRGCAGRPLTADYYVATAPSSTAEAGQQAFAARSHTGVYLFYDGIAPNEADIDNGLATPLEQRTVFKIP